MKPHVGCTPWIAGTWRVIINHLKFQRPFFFFTIRSLFSFLSVKGQDKTKTYDLEFQLPLRNSDS